jgi:hypothetical protein
VSSCLMGRQVNHRGRVTVKMCTPLDPRNGDERSTDGWVIEIPLFCHLGNGSCPTGGQSGPMHYGSARSWDFYRLSITGHQLVAHGIQRWDSGGTEVTLMTALWLTHANPPLPWMSHATTHEDVKSIHFTYNSKVETFRSDRADVYGLGLTGVISRLIMDASQAVWSDEDGLLSVVKR